MKKPTGIGLIRRATRTTALLLTLLLPTVAAYALTVGQAKQAGLVIETRNGYLQAVSGRATPAVNALVNQTNAARKAKYREIAGNLNMNLNAVEQDFGRKLGGK
ncbi:MAG: YdbL family protein [Candidatus Thiosymbion ectosymbiont of Robbea hypermnestra]|nr:YdbL family protein [Candidatus Thiosymbion ectosymbiont of Robbea hypermnestra]